MNISKIVDFLKNIKVAENYNWEIPFNKGFGNEIFTEEDLQPFNNLTNFEQNVLLKSLMCKKLHEARVSDNIIAMKKIFEWIVHDWGGIRNGRKNIENLYNIGINAIIDLLQYYKSIH